MRFAHLADCHVGSWRDPRMRLLADEAFEKAISEILTRGVDFVLIAGDLFNTALPAIQHVKHVTAQLMRLKNEGVPVYVIAGSHDYSPTGKTMLEVLEEAGLCINVFKGEVVDGALHLLLTQDPGTGVKLTGILGKAGQLDTELYETLNKERLESVDGTKIFLFHTTIDELKPKGMEKVDSQSISHLPKGFSYYAGGHVHIVDSVDLPGYPNVVYPGPLFPASFSELEDLVHGGFYIVEGDHGNFERTRIPIITKKPLVIHFDIDQEPASGIEAKLREALNQDVQDKIVLVRLSGKLSSGASTDIDFRGIFADCEKRGAYFCMKNTVALRSPEFVEEDFEPAPQEDVEAKVLDEHAGQVPLPGVSKEEEIILSKKLIDVLSKPQTDGEGKSAYEERILEEAKSLLQ